MRTKVTLILVFLNVALFFFIFGFERKWRTEENARESRRRVLGPEATNIQFIELTGPALAAPVRLERNGDSWRITAPYEWPANPFAVERIVKELQFLEHETTYEVANLSTTGLSLADYALDAPPLTVTFGSSLPDAETAPASATPPLPPPSLAIGKKTAIGNRLYVLSPDGTRIHVVSQRLADALAIQLEDLRASACFTIPSFEVRSINLQNAGPANVRVRIRREGNRWSFESPIVTRADSTRTEITRNQLVALEVSEFIGAPGENPEQAAASGTNNPTLRITLEGNNRRETLLLGNPIGATAIPADAATSPDVAYYARMENQAALFTVVLPGQLLEDLRNAQSALRDPLVLDLADRRIDSLTLSDKDGREVILQKLEDPSNTANVLATNSGWQVVQRAADGTLRTQPADQAVVEEQLLRDLRELRVNRAEDFVRDVPTEAELETWGLNRPERSITLNFAPETIGTLAADNINLLIGANQTGDETFAKLRRQSFVYRVDPAILEKIPVSPLHYRQRLLRELPAGARITGFSLRDLSNGALIYQRELAEGETWDRLFSEMPSPQGPALTVLREQVRTLRARRFASDHFTDTVTVNGEERGWRFRLDVKLSLNGDAGNQVIDSTLFIADRDGGDLQLVGSPEFDVVFAATQRFIDAVWTLSYAPRDPGPIEPTPPPAGMPTTPPDNAAPQP